MKKVFIDYLISGHRAGDFEFKIREAPWIFSGIFTIQLCSIELLMAKIFEVFNPQAVLTSFFLTYLFSIILMYSNKRIFRKIFLEIKDEGEFKIKKNHENKFILMIILSLIICFVLLLFAMRPYMKS